MILTGVMVMGWHSCAVVVRDGRCFWVWGGGGLVIVVIRGILVLLLSFVIVFGSGFDRCCGDDVDG